MTKRARRPIPAPGKQTRTTRQPSHSAQKRTPQRARTKPTPPIDARVEQTRTLQGQARFLREFAKCGNVLRAARAAKVGRRTVYEWRKDEPFKTLYEEAHEDALDLLEEEARRRAVDGVLEPLVSAGQHVCNVRKYSDTLLITLLKGKRPDTYRERHEHVGKDGKALFQPVKALSTEELKTEIAAAARELGLEVTNAPA